MAKKNNTKRKIIALVSNLTGHRTLCNAQEHGEYARQASSAQIRSEGAQARYLHRNQEVAWPQRSQAAQGLSKSPAQLK